MNFLIIIDMQNDFITGPLGTLEAQAIVDGVAMRMSESLQRSESVFLTLDSHDADYLSTREGRYLPIPHCIIGTHGHGIDQRIEDAIHNRVTCFKKNTFSADRVGYELRGIAWRRSKLDDYQDQDKYCRGSGIEIELCGVCTDICVISNALMLKSMLPEATIVVNSQLCAGTTPERHKAALDVMRSCQIEVI